MHLVFLETSANQAYLFATNRLRENIGASELTYRAGTRFVLDAVRKLGGPTIDADSPQALRDGLIDAPARNGIELLVVTSGKALVLVPDHDTGHKLVRMVTQRAIEEAPGLDLCGVVSAAFAWEDVALHQVIKSLHQRFDAVRGNRPAPQARFATLPVTEPCASSGLPAHDLVPEGDGLLALSRPSLAKRKAAEQWQQRTAKLLAGSSHWVLRRVADLESLFEDLSWYAVVHADGNGLGHLFLNLHQHIANLDNCLADANRRYIDTLRLFSIALEEATELAFLQALNALYQARGRTAGQADILPIVPLILGGDDLTVLCDGRYALAFTRRYLQAFEAQTAREDLRGGVIPKVAGKAFARACLAAGAGVAITKPHFPFASGYRLAESLAHEAKEAVKSRILRQLKTVDEPKTLPYPCSALTFHLLYDASFVDLATIRERQRVDGGATCLVAGPYVTTPLADLADLAGESASDPNNPMDAANQRAHVWAKDHHLAALIERVHTLQRTDPDTGRPLLPRSQMYDIRQALFDGRLVANARIRQLGLRYLSADLGSLLEADNELFRDCDPQDERGCRRETRFLDALESLDFWQGWSDSDEI